MGTIIGFATGIPSKNPELDDRFGCILCGMAFAAGLFVGAAVMVCVAGLVVALSGLRGSDPWRS